MRIKKEVRKIVASVLAFLMVVSLIQVERQSKTELGKDGPGMYLVAVQM